MSKSSQNKTAHRDQLMVGSFLVREELVRLVVLIFNEVLVEIVNLVCPTVEDFLGFLRRLTIEAQAVLLKGGKGGDELAELADCLHILRAHICDALNDFGHREQIVDHQLILVLGDRNGFIIRRVSERGILIAVAALGNINLEVETDHIHRYLGHNLTRLLDLFVDVLPHMEVGAVMLLEVAFQSDQIGQLPQSLKQRGGVLSVFDSVRVGNGNHLVVHIQKSSLVLYGFFETGGHDAVELGVLREIVLEGNDGRAVEDQPLTGIGIGDVVLLAGRDVQRLRENLPVAGCLIQKVDKIRVFKNVLHLAGGKKILDVLRDSGRDAAPFSETLPDFHAVRGGLFLFQQKVELVHVVARCLVLGAVDGNSVPHLILHDQHTELFKLFAEFADVIADEAVVDIHIRSVIEDIQRAVNIDFEGSCDALCLRLLLISQNVVEVFEDRHFLRLGVCKKLLIDHADAAVNDGLLNRLQAVLAADNQLTHREDEVGFQRQRVFLFGVVRVDVQRIDVIRADRRDADDLTAELLHKGKILGFGVADDDVILRDEEGVRHFALGGEGLTGTGRTQDQPVGVLELLAVHHDHDDTVVEYALSRSMSPTMVAYYTLHLPDKAILQSKLRELTELALESGEGNEGDEE